MTSLMLRFSIKRFCSLSLSPVSGFEDGPSPLRKQNLFLFLPGVLQFCQQYEVMTEHGIAYADRVILKSTKQALI